MSTNAVKKPENSSTAQRQKRRRISPLEISPTTGLIPLENNGHPYANNGTLTAPWISIAWANRFEGEEGE